MPCSPCKSTGKQKDKEGKDIKCPRCNGTGEAIKQIERFFKGKTDEKILS